MLQRVSTFCESSAARFATTVESNFLSLIERYEGRLALFRLGLPHNDNAPRHDLVRPSTIEWGAIPLAVLVAACARDVVPASIPDGTPSCGAASIEPAAGEVEPATLREASCALDGEHVALRFVRDDGSPFVLSGDRDGDALRSVHLSIARGDATVVPHDCHATFDASGHEAWGRIVCDGDDSLDARFHACGCTGWTARESHGAVHAAFERAEAVDFSSAHARCVHDDRSIRMVIESDGGERWSLSGRVGNGSLVDGNLALSAPAIGTVTQNIPVCSASLSLASGVASGRVHCEVCGAHGTFDAAFESECE